MRYIIRSILLENETTFFFFPVTLASNTIKAFIKIIIKKQQQIPKTKYKVITD